MPNEVLGGRVRAHERRAVERREPGLVARVDIGAVLDEKLDRFERPLPDQNRSYAIASMAQPGGRHQCRRLVLRCDRIRAGASNTRMTSRVAVLGRQPERRGAAPVPGRRRSCPRPAPLAGYRRPRCTEAPRAWPWRSGWRRARAGRQSTCPFSAGSFTTASGRNRCSGRRSKSPRAAPSRPPVSTGWDRRPVRAGTRKGHLGAVMATSSGADCPQPRFHAGARRHQHAGDFDVPLLRREQHRRESRHRAGANVRARSMQPVVRPRDGSARPPTSAPSDRTLWPGR